MNKKHGPWLIKKRTLKYQNKWIKVYEDHIVQPDKKPGTYGFIKYKSGISALAMDDKNYVYLTDEFSYAIGKRSLETVSGGIDKNEKPLRAAKRELKEELGIEAKRWIRLGVVNPFTSVINSPAHLFLATDLKLGKHSREGTEAMKVVKVKLEKAAKMVMQSKITHAQSCVLILKAYEYLKKSGRF